MSREDLDADIWLGGLADRFGDCAASRPLFGKRLTEFLESWRVFDRESKRHAVRRILGGRDEFLRLRLDELRETMNQPLLHLRDESLGYDARQALQHRRGRLSRRDGSV